MLQQANARKELGSAKVSVAKRIQALEAHQLNIYKYTRYAKCAS